MLREDVDQCVREEVEARKGLDEYIRLSIQLASEFFEEDHLMIKKIDAVIANPRAVLNDPSEQTFAKKIAVATLKQHAAVEKLEVAKFRLKYYEAGDAARTINSRLAALESKIEALQTTVDDQRTAILGAEHDVRNLFFSSQFTGQIQVGMHSHQPFGQHIDIQSWPEFIEVYALIKSGMVSDATKELAITEIPPTAKFIWIKQRFEQEHNFALPFEPYKEFHAAPMQTIVSTILTYAKHRKCASSDDDPNMKQLFGETCAITKRKILDLIYARRWKITRFPNHRALHA